MPVRKSETRAADNPIAIGASARAGGSHAGASARWLRSEDDAAPKSFDDAVDKLAARGRVPRTEAMRQARKSFPDLLAKFEVQGNEAIAKAAPRPAQKSDDVLSFEKCINRVQARDRCGRLAALTRAAREYPKEREAYASALS